MDMTSYLLGKKNGGGGGPDNAVVSDYITTIWKGTQAEYDAITTKDETTMYLIEKE